MCTLGCLILINFIYRSNVLFSLTRFQITDFSSFYISLHSYKLQLFLNNLIFQTRHMGKKLSCYNHNVRSNYMYYACSFPSERRPFWQCREGGTVSLWRIQPSCRTYTLLCVHIVVDIQQICPPALPTPFHGRMSLHIRGNAHGARGEVDSQNGPDHQDQHIWRGQPGQDKFFHVGEVIIYKHLSKFFQCLIIGCNRISILNCVLDTW